MFRPYLFPEGLYTISIPDSYATLQNELVVVDFIVICLPSHCTWGFGNTFRLFLVRVGAQVGWKEKEGLTSARDTEEIHECSQTDSKQFMSRFCLHEQNLLWSPTGRIG
jgi:hypothetical protein